MHAHTNHLIKETSPYLLQHAHNPVNWYPWSDEALQRARDEDKPILVSIGYSACHWCHVMERESFENEDTAAFMNEHFINIKIDREERPDLDHIYMDAIQAMTGSGGWPLNVFLTPERKPFYGGTYYPPKRAFNRASWQEVLMGVAQAFRDKREEIDSQANNLTQHLLQSNSFGSPAAINELLTPDKMKAIYETIMQSADREWGGFGRAPKFPQTFTIQYLLRYSFIASRWESDGDGISTSALQQAILSLGRMIEGGIYDQLGGGFARYSTDAEWLAPHFEKMLYDNALLIATISEAYQLTGNERYREVIEETIGFIEREMMSKQKGFYAALDADSEGEEGRFYVWKEEEINQLLGSDAAIFSQYYDVSAKGNWEGKNILRVKQPLEKFAAAIRVNPEALKETLQQNRKVLLQEREQRVRPGLDDKIILGWNALMNTACSKAFAATGEERYRKLAIDNMNFLLEHFAKSINGEFYHTWKNGEAKYPAFLDDYAFMVQALIQLQEITGNTIWLKKAEVIAGFVIEYFSESETGFFFYTGKGQDDVIVRKKEVYDGATPSGNAVMAANLYYLGVLLDKTEWRERSVSMLGSLGQSIFRYPTSFGAWCGQLLGLATGFDEVAILGKDYDSMLKQVLEKYLPYRVLMASENSDENFPLLVGKKRDVQTNVYICKDYACLQPVTTIEEVMSLINSKSGQN